MVVSKETVLGPVLTRAYRRVTTCWVVYAILLSNRLQGSQNMAVQLLERALSIRTKKLGGDHQDTVITQHKLELLRKRGHAQETD